MDHTSSRPGVRQGHWNLAVLGGWRLEHDGTVVRVPLTNQKLTAFLALDGPCSRRTVAATLWPDGPEDHANSSLRTALHRVRQRLPGLLAPDLDPVSLGPDVHVDIHALRPGAGSSEDVWQVAPGIPETADLLPTWYDDWVVVERERFRQLWLHAVEERAALLAERSDYRAALDAALTAVRAEPLRESAHRLVIRLHLAEGNPSEAMRAYERYREFLFDELQVAPSAQMGKLVADLPGREGNARLTPVHESREHGLEGAAR